MSQAVAAGLIMIGPRFGGAVTDAGRYFKHAVDRKMTVDDFLAYMKKEVGPVPGIGHRIKSLRNPDKRVKELVSYVKGLGIPTPHLDFALAVAGVGRDDLPFQRAGGVTAGRGRGRLHHAEGRDCAAAEGREGRR